MFPTGRRESGRKGDGQAASRHRECRTVRSKLASNRACCGEKRKERLRPGRWAEEQGRPQCSRAPTAGLSAIKKPSPAPTGGLLYSTRPAYGLNCSQVTIRSASRSEDRAFIVRMPS